MNKNALLCRICLIKRQIMGRKPKIKGNNLQILNFAKDIANAPVTKLDTAYNYIKWGARNTYPNILLDLYNSSTTHRAAINFEVQATIGGGIDFEAMQIDGSQVFPNYSESWMSLLRSITLDYFIFGQLAVEIIKNKDDKTFSFYHVPMDKVRAGEMDEDGVITKYAICSDWTRVSQNPPIWLDAIDMRDSDAIERGKPYIYVLHNYTPTQEYYASPLYQAGIKAIQCEIEHTNYDLRTTVNNFTASGILTLPQVETDEQRAQLISNVQNLFTSSEQACSVMVAFKENVDDVRPEYTPIAANIGNVNLYDSANARTINRILSAHQIQNAALIGLPDLNGSGFASEADKLEVSFNLWNLLSGNYHRSCIVGSINSMFKLNNIGVELILKPLRFTDDTESNNGTAPESNQDVSTDNIEEKVV